MSVPSPHLGIVVGESSGDLIGAEILQALREHFPGLRCSGIGGPRLQKLGCELLAPMSALSLFGLWEPLRHLPELLKLRRRLYLHFVNQAPQLVLGIDAPDFNLGLEEELRTANIPVAHCVSPSVWAWRPGRMQKIARAVDLMLLLFPFEEEIYRRHKVPARFIGHPLADRLHPAEDRTVPRAMLGLPGEGAVVALLPGSRDSELRRHMDLFLRTALYLHRYRCGIHFVIPVAESEQRNFVEQRCAEILGKDRERVSLSLSDSAHQTLAAADTALIASGTATLEALLLNCPMVVYYRLDFWSSLLAPLLVRLPHFSLPNLLHGGALVPEFLNRQASADILGKALLARLSLSSTGRLQLEENFAAIRNRLRRGAAENAARELVPFLSAGQGT